MALGTPTLGTLGHLGHPPDDADLPGSCDPEWVWWIQADGTVHAMDAANGVCPGRPFGRFMPPTVRREQVRPEGPGTVIIGLGHGSRLVRLPVAFTADDAEGLLGLLRSWALWLNVLDGEGWLRYTSDYGGTRVLRCAYHAGLELEEERGSQRLGVMLTDLTFVAADPYWTDHTAVEVPIGQDERDAFLPIPNESTGSFVTLTSATAWADVDVTNDGDLPAFPVWTVTGPAAGMVRFADSDSGEHVELEGVVLAEGESLVIDVEAGTVTIEGVNAWPLVTDLSRMWLLPPGTTQVGVEVGEAGDDTTVTLAFRRLWLSV